ncbi:MAG: hypothetical protein Q6365_008735 [Candidatus Sigynarchaeota archaeon]
MLITLKRLAGSTVISILISIAVLFILQAVAVDAVDEHLEAAIDDQLLQPAAGIWYITFLYSGLIVGAFAVANMITSRKTIGVKHVLVSNAISASLALLISWTFSCVVVFALNPYLPMEFILVANTLFLIVLRDPNVYFALVLVIEGAFNTMVNVLAGVY